MKKYIFLAICSVIALTAPNWAYASCWVGTGSDILNRTDSLRSIIENKYNTGQVRTCVSTQSDLNAGYAEAIKFITNEIVSRSSTTPRPETVTNNTIVLTAPLRFNNTVADTNVVVGNLPADGVITLDGRQHFSDKAYPIVCAPSTNTVHLRNIRILTNNLNKNALFPATPSNVADIACLQDAGNVEVCYAEGRCDPNGTTTPPTPPSAGDLGKDNDGDGFCEGVRPSRSTGQPGTRSRLRPGQPLTPYNGQLVCDEPNKQVGDCDDTNPNIHPNAVESCNNIDENCNDIIDDIPLDSALGAVFYRDRDGDGYGSTSDAEKIRTCGLKPAGYSEQSDDCEDGNATMNPNAAPICDPSNPRSADDNNCDGLADKDDTSENCFSPVDNDGDGWTVGGRDNTSEFCRGATDPVKIELCSQPDCDDNNPDVNPGKTEICDDLDVNEDCSAATPNEPTWYIDTDKDGYGNQAGDKKIQCDAPTGDTAYVQITDAKPADCDDTKGDIKPGIDEKCNQAGDENCNGLANDDDPFCSSSAADRDQDGYSENSGDCDDDNPNIHPGLIDMCDNVDNDCESLTDDQLCEGQRSTDDDGDGMSEDEGDCDDGERIIHSNANEVCGDSIDNDCDGLYDETIGGNVTDLEGCVEATIGGGEPTTAAQSTGGCSCDLSGQTKAPSSLVLLLALVLSPLTLVGGLRLIQRIDPIE